MPSLTPSSSGQPSSEPSVTPSESAQPSSMPSLVPSESLQPSSMPSVTPSESAQPSSMPSLVPSESLQPSSMPSVTPSESAQPSSMPSFTRATKIMNLLLSANVLSEGALDDEDSPRGKAFLWVTTTPLQLQPGEDDAQIIQQYILAVFYYATGGAGWTDKEGWLESSDECTWDYVVCNGSGVVTQLIPSFNNLVGSIPSEVGSLDSLGYLNLYNNMLTGEIPTELGELGSLGGLSLDTNQLTGEIPTELGKLDNLEYLILSGNQLSGGIDGGICNLGLTTLWADCNVCEFISPNTTDCCTFCFN